MSGKVKRALAAPWAIALILAGPAASRAAVRLFDTGAPSLAPLPSDALSGIGGWTRVPEGEVAHRFQGDAVLLNDRIALALRRRGRGAELHSVRGGALRLRARLAPSASGPLRLSALEIAGNGPDAAGLDAAFDGGGAGPVVLRYELRIGQVFVETRPRGRAAALRVEAPCRFAALPDFFADDLVIDATEIPAADARLPSDHFLLELLGRGEAILMAVSKRRGEDIRVTLSGRGEARAIDGAEIRYGGDGAIWVALLEGPGIWHRRDIAAGDAGERLPLAWRIPHPAHWRVDWRLADGLTDSWEMIEERPNGSYVKHGWFGPPATIPANRRRWTTVLGWFAYPCWIDRNGRAYLRPLERVVRFRGPAIIYPIDRVRGTPLDAYTVVDIARATLGLGPCEYILDVEGQKAAYRGIATCGARDVLDAIYARGEQRRRRATVEKTLDDVLAFVRHIRGRIEAYVAFGRAMRAYLAEQRGPAPELAGPLDAMDRLAAEIQARYDRRRARIRTPEEAATLIERFRTTLIDYEGPDALARCKAITAAIVAIGGNQDELVGECRMAVRILRQRAGLAMAAEPRFAGIAAEIRRRTRAMLRSPTTYEAPRH